MAYMFVTASANSLFSSSENVPSIVSQHATHGQLFSNTNLGKLQSMT